MTASRSGISTSIGLGVDVAEGLFPRSGLRLGVACDMWVGVGAGEEETYGRISALGVGVTCEV